MRRRNFIVVLGAGSTAPAPLGWALAQDRVFRVGLLASLSQAEIPEVLAAFRETLREHGYVEGRNLKVEYRWAAQLTRSSADELIALKVDVIVAWTTPAVAAARGATSKIPIVMVGVADAVGSGFVASLSRPGGNITGTTNIAKDLGAKLLELLLEVAPGTNPVYVLRNSLNPGSALQWGEVEASARSQGVRVVMLEVTSPEDLSGAFARIVRENGKGAIALADPLLISQRALIATLAQKAGLPVVFSRRENVDAGGLISYGPSLRGQFRATAVFVDKILRGANPAELPVEQPTLLELIVNLKAANALGLRVPQSILLRADEVIE